MNHESCINLAKPGARLTQMLVLVALLSLQVEAVVNPPFSTFELPGTTLLGDQYTLAVHADNREAALDFTRLFSSFRGVGPVGADRILMDYDPTGGVIPGIRAIVNNTVVQTTAPPAGVTNPGYHHYALTVDNGDVRIYFDGSEVATGNVGNGYTNTANLHFGEDPHDGGGSANEQFIGHVDELLILNRALSASDVLALVTSGVSDVVNPGSELAIYYDFESDLMDQFVADGAQDGIARQNATIDDVPGNAKRGDGSGFLGVATPGSVNPEAIPEPLTATLGLISLCMLVQVTRRRTRGI